MGKYCNYSTDEEDIGELLLFHKHNVAHRNIKAIGGNREVNLF